MYVNHIFRFPLDCLFTLCFFSFIYIIINLKYTNKAHKNYEKKYFCIVEKYEYLTVNQIKNIIFRGQFFNRIKNYGSTILRAYIRMN